jgi:hypothetical protein
LPYACTAVEQELLLVNAGRTRPGRPSLVAGLGLAQLAAWGTLYYPIAVTAEPLQRTLGLSQAAVYGAFALSLGLAGALAPLTGHLVDRFGGRQALCASALCGALGLVLLAFARSWPQLLFAHVFNGLAMALGLYEACFVTLAQLSPSTYRRDVTVVVLIGGLASSVFWPLTYELVAAHGVRYTLLAYAALQLFCLAVYVALPSRQSTDHACELSAHRPRMSAAAVDGPKHVAVVVAFAAATGVGAATNAHLLAALETLELEPASAAWLAAAVGVCQVLGRATELRPAHAFSGLKLGAWSLFALAAALGCLALGRGVAAGWVFVILFGASNGVLTIAKAVVPIELFGSERPGQRLAAFAWPSLLARAAAPFLLAQLSWRWGLGAGLTTMLTVAGLSALSYAWAARGLATRLATEPRTTSAERAMCTAMPATATTRN